MAKKPNEMESSVTLTIEDGTTIIVGEVKYSGTVIVDETTAKTIKKTGKVRNGNPTIN